MENGEVDGVVNWSGRSRVWVRVGIGYVNCVAQLANRSEGSKGRVSYVEVDGVAL